MGTPYILYTILSKTIQGLLILYSKGQSVKEVSSLSLSLLRRRESREAARNQNDQRFNPGLDWITNQASCDNSLPQSNDPYKIEEIIGLDHSCCVRRVDDMNDECNDKP